MSFADYRCDILNIHMCFTDYRCDNLNIHICFTDYRCDIPYLSDIFIINL